jgi:hypothetical protein
VEGASLLYAHPPKGGELSVLPLEALTKGFQVVLTDLRIPRVFVGIGKGYGDEPSLESLEGSLRLMLAKRLKRFLRLNLENPLTLLLIPWLCLLQELIWLLDL